MVGGGLTTLNTVIRHRVVRDWVHLLVGYLGGYEANDDLVSNPRAPRVLLKVFEHSHVRIAPHRVIPGGRWQIWIGSSSLDGNTENTALQVRRRRGSLPQASTTRSSSAGPGSRVQPACFHQRVTTSTANRAASIRANRPTSPIQLPDRPCDYSSTRTRGAFRSSR